VQLRPPHHQRRLRPRRELPGLGAAEIRVEREPARIRLLQEHHARARPPARIHGGERHRVGLEEAVAHRVEEPTVEQRGGVAGARDSSNTGPR
jgi:hypothetical protein